MEQTPTSVAVLTGEAGALRESGSMLEGETRALAVGPTTRQERIASLDTLRGVAVMGILAGVTHHFDFAGHSDLGLTTLVGTALSELQVYTYPSGSLKTAGASLEMSF